MACHHPLPGWQKGNSVTISNDYQRGATRIALPCGKCLGCRTAHAQAWALRCQLELQQHRTAVFTTLTYDDQHLPVTLEKRHVQLWLKRLRQRANEPIRFFASGEYGEKTQRPHYHAIIYGADLTAAKLIEDTWGQGHARTMAVTPAAIAYTAGYTSKKIGFQRAMVEQVDPETGEVYTWQPPFIQMSRKPGIGGHARKWVNSWRSYAIQNGTKQPVPRYLHEAWKAQATEQEREQLRLEREKFALERDNSIERLHAAEQIAMAKQAIAGDRRRL